MRDPERRAAGPHVHPTAVVHPGARLGDGVRVGPYAVIEDDTVIGDGTVIGPHTVIHAHVEVGRDNHLAAHVVIGSRPQDRAYRGEPTRVVIGDGNIISEFASVDRATGDGLETRIGHGAYIMSGVRISHNCVVGDGAVVVSGTQLGGWVHLGPQAYLGGISGIHQFVHVGRLAMVAGHSGVRQDVPPYVMAAGFRARAVGLNTVGMVRHGLPPADRLALRRAFRLVYRSGLPMAEALRALDPATAASPAVQEFVDFIRAAAGRHRGIVRWQAATEL